MSKMKKRITLIGVVLTLLLSCAGVMFAMFARAAETVPLPTGNTRGVARMRTDIYKKYRDELITKDQFNEYAAYFDTDKEFSAELNHPIYGNRFKLTPEKDRKGLSNASIELNSDSNFSLTLYGGALSESDMKGTDLLVRTFMAGRAMIGTNGSNKNLFQHPVSGSVNSDVEFIVDGSKYMQWKRTHYGRYYWDIDTYGSATLSNFGIYLLDGSNPGENGWTATLHESGDAEDTVYQLHVKDNGNTNLRAVNKNITYEELAMVQLEVTMKSTSTQTKVDENGNEIQTQATYTIPAKAVGFNDDYTALIFDFYGDTWRDMEDQVMITKIVPKLVMPEGTDTLEYDIYDLYYFEELPEEFGIKANMPVTDFAGNEIKWEGYRCDLEGLMSMDRMEAVITAVNLYASNFTSGAGSTEVNWNESFSSWYNYIRGYVTLNEEMMLTPEAKAEAYANVKAQWNLRYADGTPVITDLEIMSNRTNRNGTIYTELTFKAFHIEEGMTPQGEQIVIEKILGEEHIYDRVGNNFLNNEVLMTGDVNTSIWPEQVTYLDTMAPAVELGDTIIREKFEDDTQQKLEAIHITVPFNVKDFDPGEGKMNASAAGTTASLYLTNPIANQKIDYRYAITYSQDFPAADEAGVQWYTGNLGRSKYTPLSSFGVPAEGTPVYLHMELANLTNYEISETEGLEMELWVTDMVHNITKQHKTISGIYVDNIAPQAQFVSQKATIRLEDGVNKAEFFARVKVTDLNGINLIGYRFVDPNAAESEKGEYTYAYNGQETGSYSKSETVLITKTYEGDGLVEKVLEIQVIDKKNNQSNISTSFSADLTKVVSNYEIMSDIHTPSDAHEIMIYAPTYLAGTLADTASTRVTVVVPTGMNESYEETYDVYFRVMKASELANGVQALDPNATNWYKAGNVVTIGDENYGFGAIEAVDGVPGWASHYGQMDVYIASSNLALDKIEPGSEEGSDYLLLRPTGDLTYSGGKLCTVYHAGKVDNAYTMSYAKSGSRVLITDATGTEVAAAIKWQDDDISTGEELYRYAKFNQTLAGIRVDVELENVLQEDWGTMGIDFENSYAVLVRTDAEGNMSGCTEVTERLPLANALEQTLSVPGELKEGESFTSGVYTWVVHVAQLGGGVSDFATGEVYLILDNANTPENFGVLEHTTRIQAVEGYGNSYHQYVENTVKPQEGENTLRVVNIGIAKPTALMTAEYEAETETTTWRFTEDLEKISIDGCAAYYKGIANGSEFGGSYQTSQFGKFTITADMTESGYGSFLGQEVGTVKGIRFWNKANVEDYTRIAYVQKDQSYYDSGIRGVSAVFSQADGVAKLDVSFNVAWYMGSSSPLYENAEALKEALPNGTFGVIDGENTICYQLLMDNGRESPIYQFTLNLIDEVPEVNVEFAFGPYFTEYVDTTNDGVDNGIICRNAEYVDVFFNDLISDYSGLRVYHVRYNENGTDEYALYYDIIQLTEEQLSEGYRMEYGCSGYDGSYNYDNFGYKGTNLDGRYNCEGSETFFVIVDNSGNAVTVYPIDSMEHGQVLGYKFAPDAAAYDGVDGWGYNNLRLTYEETGYNGGIYNYGASLEYNSVVQFRLDSSDDSQWVSYDMASGVDLPNNAGLGLVEDSNVCFVAPYDPNVAEGEEISHTADVRVYGERNAQGQPNYSREFTVSFTAPNTKPAVTGVEAFAGGYKITYNVPVMTDGGASNEAIVGVDDDSVFGTTVAHTFVDLCGNKYTEEIEIPAKPEDPIITYFANEPGKVTVTSRLDGLYVESGANWFVFEETYIPVYDENGTQIDGYTLYYDAAHDMWYDNNMELYCEKDRSKYYLDAEKMIVVEGNRTDELTLIGSRNFQADVYYYSGDYAACVDVKNFVYDLTPDPCISWSIRKTDVVDGIYYGEVTAYLVDVNGANLLDPATGLPAKFVFTPDGPDSYTFTGCYSEATGDVVADITASLSDLGIDELRPLAFEGTDTLAPDVDIEAYLTVDTGAKNTGMVYRHSSGQREMYDYGFKYGYDPADSFVYYEDVNDMISRMGWSKSYMFHLKVYDESRVKLILSKDIRESGITYNTLSEKVDGVTLLGRTLQVEENCEFALYIVDERNNITAIHFKVDNLTGAPVPELIQVESKTADGKPAIRVYLLPPQLDAYSDLLITNTGAVQDLEVYEEMISDYYGLYYLQFSRSEKNYPVDYSYKVPGYEAPFTGRIHTDITVPVLVSPGVSTFFWSANYYNQATSQEVALNLKLNTAVRDIDVVYTTADGVDYLIPDLTLEEAGVYLSFFQTNATVIFENNSSVLMDKLEADHGAGTLRLKLAELEYGEIGYYVLPAVSNIDTTAASGTYSIDVNRDDYKSAVITVTMDETVLTGDGRQKGTTFEYTVRENQTYTYSFVDMAGNRSTIEVPVTDLITDKLTIVLSTNASDAGIIAEPTTYEASVGQTLYAKTNRDATLYVYGKNESDSTQVSVAANTWTAFKVTENSMGLHPSIVARDNYGNVTILQLEYIPIRDITAPAAFLHREVVSVSGLSTEAEINEALMDNLLYSDDTSAQSALTVDIDYVKVESGRTVVTYTITDEEGNFTVRQCYLRIRSGLEPVIHVNGELVEDGAFMYISNTKDLQVTVSMDADVAEPYKLVYEPGDLRSWAKLKDGTWLTAGYEDANSQTYTLEDLGDGWYSFALTTQGMEVYYFQVHVGQVGR